MYLNQVSAEQKAKAPKGSLLVKIGLKNGDIFEGIFRKPSMENLQRYLHDKEESKDAHFTPMRNFIMDLLLSPSPEALLESIKSTPMLVMAIYGEVAAFLGLTETTETQIL